jgi:hypothetical protein
VKKAAHLSQKEIEVRSPQLHVAPECVIGFMVGAVDLVAPNDPTTQHR